MHNSRDHGHARCAQGQHSRVSGPHGGPKFERAPAKPARSRSDESGWTPQPVETVRGDECRKVCGQDRPGGYNERRNQMCRFVGLRAFAVVARFTRSAGPVLAVTEALARSALVSLAWTAIASRDDGMCGCHLGLAAPDMRNARQPVAG